MIFSMRVASSILPLRIVANGDTSELSEIRRFVEANAEQFGFSESESAKIALAVDEACSNIIRHSYHNDISREFVIELDQKNRQFIISILDEGQPFNPLSIPSPNMKEYLAQYRHGGLGIHIIKMVMDAIDYAPASNPTGWNRLTLMKALA
jgi:serine/threonine-protein kinase RsbW